MFRQINVYMDKHAYYLSWIHVCSPKALVIRKWIPHSLLWQYRNHVCNGNSQGKRCSPITKISRVWWSWWEDWWAIASTLKIDLRSARIVVILDSGFCVLKGIIELRKKGLYASVLIKKRRFWPKYIRGEEIKAHFESLECGFADAWPGKLDNIPFHIYCMKEPG